MKILNFGSCNIDYVYSVDKIVSPGETLAADALNIYEGGKGLNQSIALARAGAHVYHAGCIGSDGDMLKSLMQSCGVNLNYLETVDYKTGHAIIQVDGKGENCIIIYKGANGCITREYVHRVLADFGNGDILLLQNEINEIEYIIKRASDLGMTVMLNPSPFAENLKSINLDDISYLILNEIEAQSFSGTDDIHDFKNWVRSYYPQLRVVLTLGGKGSLYFDANNEIKQAAYKVKAVDTTAAGDTFTGYFAAGISRGDSIGDALKYASVAAAISVSIKGAAPSVPMRGTVEDMLSNLCEYSYDDISEKHRLVISYIENHLADASLEVLAKRLGYSPSYLSRWLKEHMNSTFSNILIKTRCRIAAIYLLETSIPIAEIISTVGYKNESFFRKNFMSIYGCTPLEYRRKQVK